MNKKVFVDAAKRVVAVVTTTDKNYRIPAEFESRTLVEIDGSIDVNCGDTIENGSVIKQPIVTPEPKVVTLEDVEAKITALTAQLDVAKSELAVIKAAKEGEVKP